MVLTERLGSVEFAKDVSSLSGMKISRVWLGYADALFLECGRLKREKQPLPKKASRCPPEKPHPHL
jgi:hypothetical protein